MTPSWTAQLAVQMAVACAVGAAGYAVVRRVTRRDRANDPGSWNNRAPLLPVGGMSFAAAFAVAALGISLAGITSAWVRSHASLSSAQILAAWGTQAALVVGAWAGIRLAGFPAATSLGLNRAPRPGLLLALVPGALTAMLPLLVAASVASAVLCRALGLPFESQDIVRLFASLDSWTARAAWIVTGALLAPLAEEVFFRGFLYPALKAHHGRGAALAATAALFGAVHLSATAFLPLAVVGLALALIYETTGSLWCCIAGHALFNSVQFVLILALPELVR